MVSRLSTCTKRAAAHAVTASTSPARECVAAGRVAGRWGRCCPGTVGRCRFGSAVDGGHVRFVVAFTGGRSQVAEPFELAVGELDDVGGGVLLDAGDPPGAGDRGDVVALGEQPGQGDLRRGGAGFGGDGRDLADGGQVAVEVLAGEAGVGQVCLLLFALLEPRGAVVPGSGKTVDETLPACGSCLIGQCGPDVFKPPREVVAAARDCAVVVTGELFDPLEASGGLPGARCAPAQLDQGIGCFRASPGGWQPAPDEVAEGVRGRPGLSRMLDAGIGVAVSQVKRGRGDEASQRHR
jgi:hypothetical protein